MAGDDLSQALGRIEGKLDQALEAAREHREDDKRRFTEVFGKLEKHDQDIAQAKGAKGAILWLLCGGAAAIGAAVSALGRAFGVH